MFPLCVKSRNLNIEKKIKAYILLSLYFRSYSPRRRQSPRRRMSPRRRSPPRRGLPNSRHRPRRSPVRRSVSAALWLKEQSLSLRGIFLFLLCHWYSRSAPHGPCVTTCAIPFREYTFNAVNVSVLQEALSICFLLWQQLLQLSLA